MCLNGVCQNYRGGYQCLCNPGFMVSEDMKSCVGEKNASEYSQCSALIPLQLNFVLFAFIAHICLVVVDCVLLWIEPVH